MDKIGLVIDGSDHFIIPIEHEFRKHYHVRRFKPWFIRAPLIGRRLNERLLRCELSWLLNSSDVVFFEWAGSLLVEASHLPQKNRIIARLHSIELVTSANRIDWSCVDTLVVVSEKMRERIQHSVANPPRQIVVVSNGVDLKRFDYVEREFKYRIGMVCSVLPIKRVYDMVLSVYALRKKGYPFTLQVVGRLNDQGEPRYVWAIQEMVAALGMENTIMFTGQQKDTTSYYQQMDVFLSNSYWEGQQMALLEAMATGCYCLSHHWGGAEEVLPEDNLFITDAELQDKLIAYANMRSKERLVLQQKMRTIVQDRFDQRVMLDKLLNVIGYSA